MKLFKTDEDRFTRDFNDMLKIALLNSSGFFFISFWIPVIASINMGATGIQLGVIVAVQVLGRMLSGFIIGFLTDHIKSRTKLVLHYLCCHNYQFNCSIRNWDFYSWVHGRCFLGSF